MRYRKTLLGSCAVAALSVPATLPGCAGPKATTRTSTLDQWAQRMDDVGLVAVFPPSEDVRVGDVYALAVDPGAVPREQRRAAARLISASTRWASLPVQDELAREYRQRRSLPQTPEAVLQVPGTPGVRTWLEPTTPAGESLFSSEAVPTRLRIVSMDLFTSISLVTDELNAIIPSEAVPLLTGSADPDALTITMQASSGESYSLSLEGVIALIAETANDGSLRLRSPYRDNLIFMADPATHRVWIQVITEVVYLRSADLSIRPKTANTQDDQVTAEELAQVAAAIQGRSPDGAPPAAAVQTPAEPPAEASAGTPAAPAQDSAPPTEAPGQQPASSEITPVRTVTATRLDPIYGAFLRAKAINEVLRETDANDAPGNTVRFLSVTDESVALRRTWSRGLAIGVRGLSLEVDAVNGDIYAAGPMGWSSAMTAGAFQPGAASSQ